MYWSYLLAAIGILGLWLVGRKRKSGFIIGIAAQLLWVGYAFATQQYGFLLTAAAYGIMNMINYRKWSAPEKHARPLSTVEKSLSYIEGMKAAAQTINIYGIDDGMKRVLLSVEIEADIVRGILDEHRE